MPPTHISCLDTAALPGLRPAGWQAFPTSSLGSGRDTEPPASTGSISWEHFVSRDSHSTRGPGLGGSAPGRLTPSASRSQGRAEGGGVLGEKPVLEAEGVSPATAPRGAPPAWPRSLLWAPWARRAHTSGACAPCRLRSPKTEMENSLLGPPRMCQGAKHLEPLVWTRTLDRVWPTPPATRPAVGAECAVDWAAVPRDHSSRDQAWATDGIPCSQTHGGSPARPRPLQGLLTLALVTLS